MTDVDLRASSDVFPPGVVEGRQTRLQRHRGAKLGERAGSDARERMGRIWTPASLGKVLDLGEGGSTHQD